MAILIIFLVILENLLDFFQFLILYLLHTTHIALNNVQLQGVYSCLSLSNGRYDDLLHLAMP